MVNKLRSVMWKFFTKINLEKAVCGICGVAISYKSTISNLKMHLARRHLSTYKLLEKDGFGRISSDMDDDDDDDDEEECIFEFTEDGMVVSIACNPTAVSSIPNIITTTVDGGTAAVSSSLNIKQEPMSDVDVITTSDESSNNSDSSNKINATIPTTTNSLAAVGGGGKNLSSTSSEVVAQRTSIKRPNCCYLKKDSRLRHKKAALADLRKTVTRIKKESVTTTTTTTVTPHQKALIDRDLLDLFIRDYQPFRIVKEEGLKKFVTNWIPGYQIPSKETISSVMIPNLYRDKYRLIRDRFSKQAESVCITIDRWTSSASSLSTTETYMTISGHYIDQQFEFKSALLKCCSFPTTRVDADLLVASMKATLEEWNLISKVNLVVSDNEFTISDAIKKKNTLNLNYYDCYVRNLNSIILRSLSSVQPMLEKIRCIVGHFNRDPVDDEKLLNYQMTVSSSSSAGCAKPKRLKSDMVTRWNSTFRMLRRFVQLEEAIRTTVLLSDRQNDDLPAITWDEWQLCGQLCEILSPFEEMIESMIGTKQKYMTGSSVIIVTRCLKGTCDKLHENASYVNAAKSVLTSIKAGLNDAFEHVENNRAFALCTLLDPRYKEHVFENSTALIAAKRNLQLSVAALIENNHDDDDDDTANCRRQHGEATAAAAVVDNKATADLNYNDIIIPTTEQQLLSIQPTTTANNVGGGGLLSPWSILNDIIPSKPNRTTALSRAINEIDLYMLDDILPRLNERGQINCPLEWWKNRQHIYPNLAAIFRTECNVVATSVPCEQFSCEAGYLLAERRAAGLRPNEANMIVFLNANAAILDETS